jgi:type IV pilus assembly protein PilM
VSTETAPKLSRIGSLRASLNSIGAPKNDATKNGSGKKGPIKDTKQVSHYSLKEKSNSGNVRVINPDGHCIGIDIGATAVRAAILTPGVHEGKPSVTAHGLGVVALPKGAVVNGLVVDQNTVSRALRQLWSENKFECSNVILGITHQQSVVRDLDMPQLAPDLMVKALPYQAREIVPFALDQALIDFLPLSLPDSRTELIHGLLIAVPRAPVLAAVHAAEKAGLKVARVDLSPFAALRSMADAANTVEAVIDLGAHMTNIIIHRDGVPRVVRSVNRGGAELTARIADRSGMSVADAEVAKCVNGLSGRDRSVVDVISDGIRPLLAEIRSSVQYFSTTNSQVIPQRITLTGGAAYLPGLAELLCEQLAVPTELVAPTQHISNRSSPDAQQKSPATAATAVSVGLAMGAAA